MKEVPPSKVLIVVDVAEALLTSLMFACMVTSHSAIASAVHSSDAARLVDVRSKWCSRPMILAADGARH